MSFLLLLDCQEAFHCCLVVACINRINMISIECHRVVNGDQVSQNLTIESSPVRGNHVAIPFKVHVKYSNYDNTTGMVNLHQPYVLEAQTNIRLCPNMKTLCYKSGGGVKEYVYMNNTISTNNAFIAR